MNTNWHYSTESEVKRLLHVAHQIQNHFYQTHHFIVLPQKPHHAIGQNIVIFPDLPYSKSFWKIAESININQPLSAPDSITALLSPHIKDQPIDRDIQAIWIKALPKINQLLTKILDPAKLPQSLTVFHTHFGSHASFNAITPTNPHAEIYLRQDSDLSKLTEAYIDTIIRYGLVNQLSATWTESEIVSDWLLSQTKITDIIQELEPFKDQTLIQTLRQKQTRSSLVQKSQLYLEKLGFAQTQNNFTIKDSNIYFQDRRVRGLSPRDKQILVALVNNSQVTTDQIADIIFTSEDNYSLYALSKCIQRLREKLDQNGIPSSRLKTIRNFGYSLN